MLDDWHRAAATAVEARYFRHFAFLGADATERWTAPEFGQWDEPQFQRKSAWDSTARPPCASLR